MVYANQTKNGGRRLPTLNMNAMENYLLSHSLKQRHYVSDYVELALFFLILFLIISLTGQNQNNYMQKFILVSGP